MDTPEQAKQKIRDIAEQEKARIEQERPRTYTERLQDMGRLPKPTGGGVGGSEPLTKNKAMDRNPTYKKGGTASSRADGCCIRGKTRA
jgi:hypothetical protein